MTKNKNDCFVLQKKEFEIIIEDTEVNFVG